MVCPIVTLQRSALELLVSHLPVPDAAGAPPGSAAALFSDADFTQLLCAAAWSKWPSW
tara:strand:- start:491 stop:664 length:174 start_codon:yes stop_codon:yes gene_type:complete